MAPPATFDDIRKSRDTALNALEDSLTAVGNEIAVTTTTGPVLTRLTTRNTDLMNTAAGIRAAATDVVLALPSVVAAAATLSGLSSQMKTTAATLPAVTNFLTGTATVLSLGQQFADVIAGSQKSAPAPAKTSAVRSNN
jgi:hypothetical protein